MGMQTIAKYVENDEFLQTVRSLGIDYAQGHAGGSRQLLLGIAC